MPRSYLISWSFLLLSALIVQGADEKGTQKVIIDLIISSPIEVASWGKELHVIPDVKVESDVLTYRYSKDRQEQAVIYLGKTLAILLLGLETLDTTSIQKCLLKIEEGMNAVGITKTYIDQFGTLQRLFSKKQLSRMDLANKLDLAYAQLTSTAKGNENQLYLILQGAAWVQGQNLIAKAMKASKNYEHAYLLLHSPHITQQILESLQVAQRGGSPPEIINPLMKSMNHYVRLTSTKPIGQKEINEIIKETDQFLQKY